jgi:hypothetical protein
LPVLNINRRRALREEVRPIIARRVRSAVPTDQRIQRHPSIAVGISLREVRISVVDLRLVDERVRVDGPVGREHEGLVVGVIPIGVIWRCQRDVFDLPVLAFCVVADDGRPDGRHVCHFVQGDAGEGVHLLAGVGVERAAVGDDGFELRDVVGDGAEVDLLEGVGFDVVVAGVGSGVGLRSFDAAVLFVGGFWVFGAEI